MKLKVLILLFTSFHICCIAQVSINKFLILQLDSVYADDIKYRIQLDEIENNTSKSLDQKSKQRDIVSKLMKEQDEINLKKVTYILNTYGWLGANTIGNKGNSALFLVIQHSNSTTQEKYLPIIREAVKSGKANGSELALLEDRVALSQGKKQLYGSQIRKNESTGKYELSPIEDEINLNKRRANVGLEPIEKYVKKNWGIEYKMATDSNDKLGVWTNYSIQISCSIIAILFLFILFVLFRKNQLAWFFFFLFMFIVHFIALYFEYSQPSSLLKEYKGNGVLFLSSQIIFYLFIIGIIQFLTHKILKIENIFIDVCSIFLSSVIYSFGLRGFFQKLLMPNSGTHFFFNIAEPIVFTMVYLLIKLAIYLISKRKINRKAKVVSP
jgi:hypothetical protein